MKRKEGEIKGMKETRKEGKKGKNGRQKGKKERLSSLQNNSDIIVIQFIL